MKNQIVVILAAIVLLAACKCKSNAGYDFVNNSASADSIIRDTASIHQPKLVKKATIKLKVKSVSATSKNILKLTDDYHGMLLHNEMESATERSSDVRISSDSVVRIVSLNTNARLTIKIPVNKLEEFLEKVETMGIYVNNRSIDIEDKSMEYTSSKLKLKNRLELVHQQKNGKITIKDPNNVLMLKDDMVDEQIASQDIDEKIKNATINLDLYQSNTITKETIVNDEPQSYNIPFLNRAQMAFANGWQLFSDIVIGLLNLWMIILLAILTYFVYNYFRKNKSKLTVPVIPQQ